jgi:hypothetical protein
MGKTVLINPGIWTTDIDQRVYENNMNRQLGRFVVCSNETCNIPIHQQVNLKQYLFRMKIPATSKSHIRQELRERDITRQQVFVDENTFDNGLVEVINRKYFPYLYS